MSYIIAVANEKGGVAKTTTSLSLGSSLVETGQTVLLIDLDAQANLTLALGKDPSKSIKTISNFFLDHSSSADCILESNVPGLFILPSSIEISVVERQLPVNPGYELVLRNSLEPFLNNFNFIIIDCPPHLGPLTLNALSAADLLIMPTQSEYFSVYALREMLNVIRRVRSQKNPNLTYRLLLTMFDRRNRIHRSLSEQLRLTFGNGILQTLIEVDTKLRESQIAGMPINYHAPNSRSAIQYRDLAQEIQGYVKQTFTEPA